MFMKDMSKFKIGDKVKGVKLSMSTFGSKIEKEGVIIQKDSSSLACLCIRDNEGTEHWLLNGTVKYYNKPIITFL